jgi:hypothetical protein
MSSRNNIKNLVIQDESVVKRTFDYKIGVCNLSFTLRVDIKQELKEYAQLLERGLNDVKIELERIDAKK